MASYFVARDRPADGVHAVHDRTACPPSCFPRGEAAEYLGEFFEAAQALAVARLRYAQVRGCTCRAEPAIRHAAPSAAALTPTRP